MQFGKISAKSNPKKIEQQFNFILHKEGDEHKYYLFLIDGVPKSQTCLMFLKKDLKRFGYKDFVIASCITTEKIPEQGTILKYIQENESQWRKLLGGALCVMTFGRTLYAVVKSTDLVPTVSEATPVKRNVVYNFYDSQVNEIRMFLTEEFLNAGNKWYYPVDGIESIYSPRFGSDYKNYKTQIFYEHLKIMKDQSLYPDECIDMRPYEIIIANNKDECSNYLNQLYNSDLLAADTETNSLDFTTGKLGCVTLSNDGQKGYFLPWEYINKRLLKGCLKSAKKLVMHNGKFDTKYLWKNGVNNFLPTDDTMLMSQAINSDLPKGLKPLACRYTYFGGYDDELDIIKKRLKINNYLEIPTSTLSKYATLDAIVTWRLYQALLKQIRWFDKKYPNEKLKEWGVERWYTHVMSQFNKDIIKLEYNGLFVDEEKRLKSQKYFLDKIQGFKNKLCEYWKVPKNFDFFSQKELSKQFEKMGWPKITTSKDGGYSADDTAQAEWKRLGYKGVEELADLRSHATALSAFIGISENGEKTGWEQYLRKHEDGTYRMHTEFDVMGKTSFRCSVRNPSFQNIPTRSDMAKMVKNVLTTPKPFPNYKITDDTGTVWEGYGGDYLHIIRNGKEEKVQFYQLQETDEIISYAEKIGYFERKDSF